MKELIAEAILQEMGKYRPICKVECTLYHEIHPCYVISHCGRLTIRINDDKIDIWDHDWLIQRRSYELCDPDCISNTIEAAFLILDRTSRWRIWLDAVIQLIDQAATMVSKLLRRH